MDSSYISGCKHLVGGEYLKDSCSMQPLFNTENVSGDVERDAVSEYAVRRTPHPAVVSANPLVSLSGHQLINKTHEALW